MITIRIGQLIHVSSEVFGIRDSCDNHYHLSGLIWTFSRLHAHYRHLINQLWHYFCWGKSLMPKLPDLRLLSRFGKHTSLDSGLEPTLSSWLWHDTWKGLIMKASIGPVSDNQSKSTFNFRILIFGMLKLSKCVLYSSSVTNFNSSFTSMPNSRIKFFHLS